MTNVQAAASEGAKLDEAYSSHLKQMALEFKIPVSLLTLSMIRIELEEMLGIKVDLVHGPVTSADIIEIKKEIVLYAVQPAMSLS